MLALDRFGKPRPGPKRPSHLAFLHPRPPSNHARLDFLAALPHPLPAYLPTSPPLHSALLFRPFTLSPPSSFVDFLAAIDPYPVPLDCRLISPMPS